MARADRHSVAVAVAGIILAGSCALAADWPQWRGPNRDAHVSGFAAPQTWPKSLQQKWKVAVGGGDAAPALVDGKLYVFARQGGDEVTRCLDAQTGKELWKDAFAVPAISGPAARQHSGPRSSPVVADGKVVTFGVTGVLSCLDAATGKVLWRNEQFKGVPRFYTASSPMIVGGLCIAQVGGGSDGAIVALDLASGQQKWITTGQNPDYASPVLLSVDGSQQIVALTDKNLIGVSAEDGKILWQLPFAAQGRAYNAATPIVDGQTVIFSGAGRGTRAVRIEKQGDSFTAKELWANPDTAVQFSCPVLKDGMIYGVSDKGSIYCIDAKTGKPVWSDATKRGAYGPMLDAGSAILTLTEKSELVAFAPDGKQFTELAVIKVADSPTYAYPVLDGKSLYIKDQDSLILWSFE